MVLPGKCPPSPALGGGRVGHFPRPLSRRPAWPPSRAAFRDTGLGRSKRRLSGPAFTPLPRLLSEFQLLVTSCPHVGPHTQDKRSPQGNPGKLRATRRRLCGDLVPNPRGPRARGGQGRSAGGERQAGPGAAGSRGSAPGEGPTASRAREERASGAPGRAPRAPGGRSPRRGRRVLSLSPPREPEPLN